MSGVETDEQRDVPLEGISRICDMHMRLLRKKIWDGKC